MSMKNDITRIVMNEFNRTGKTISREEVVSILHISEYTLRHYICELVSDGVFTRDIEDKTKPYFPMENNGSRRSGSRYMLESALNTAQVEACRKYVKPGDKVYVRVYHLTNSEDYQVDKPYEIVKIVGNQILLKDLKNPKLMTTITLKQYAMWLRTGKRGVIL